MIESNENVTPFDSAEYAEIRHWRHQVSNGKLEAVKAIAAWSDIAGIGGSLLKASWSLEKLQEDGVFEALNVAYEILGKPFLSGVPPKPSERILVINDGVARTLDIGDGAHIDTGGFLFYVRDLLMYHFMLLQHLVERGLGLRTVLAGGERCQYTPPAKTGHSMLFYSTKPSGYGEQLLKQQFVYNPVEFQMNTAFALAYSLEALGSRGGLIPNRIYIDQLWLDTLIEALPGFCDVGAGTITFYFKAAPAITVNYDQCCIVKVLGLETNVYRVSEFTVHKEFEGETTHFPMAAHDRI